MVETATHMEALDVMGCFNFVDNSIWYENRGYAPPKFLTLHVYAPMFPYIEWNGLLYTKIRGHFYGTVHWLPDVCKHVKCFTTADGIGFSQGGPLTHIEDVFVFVRICIVFNSWILVKTEWSCTCYSYANVQLIKILSGTMVRIGD